FDVTCLPPDAVGVVAVRPAAVFGRPGMKKHADALNLLIDGAWKGLEQPKPLPLGVEEIEQATFAVFLKSLRTKKGPQTAVLLGPAMVRAVRPVDWKKHLLALALGIVERRREGKTYYCAPKGALPWFGPQLTFFVPDDRTVVFHEEPGALKALLSRGR